MLHAGFSMVSTLPALLALAGALEWWSSPKFTQEHVTQLPHSLSVLCLWPAGPLPSRLSPAHICVQKRGEGSISWACPCAVASWTPGDPHREQLISRLIKWGLQSQCSFGCHTDLSFKAQRRKKNQNNLLFKTWKKNWLKLNFFS